MSQAWETGRSEIRETSREVRNWFTQAYEKLGQVAPAKFAQEADDAQWQVEFKDWHDDSAIWYEEWLAEKEAEARLEAYVNSPRGQDAAFAHKFGY